MWTYEQAYGFTRLRLLVSACELWLGLLFVLLLVAGVRLRGGWLAHVALATATLALLGIAILNPDRFIAERNVARFADSGKIDTEYLASLSADAVPALQGLPEPQRSCALGGIQRDLDQQGPDPWPAWNLGRYRARVLLAANPPGACSSGLR
jgi:hypothetical protein